MKAQANELVKISMQNKALDELRHSCLSAAGIDVVSVHQLTPDHQYWVLGTDSTLLASYLEAKLVVHSPAFNRLHFTQQPAIHFWGRELQHNPVFSHVFNYLTEQQLTSGLSILVHGAGGQRDLFFFGSKKMTPLSHAAWMNLVPMLMQFIEYVKTTQQSLLAAASNHAFDLPSLIGDVFFSKPESTAEDHFIPAGLQIIHPQKAKAAEFLHAARLTAKERKITELALLGRRAKEIALALNLSHRTVENYLARIREKYHCKSQKEMMARFYQTML